MREISASRIQETVTELCLKANFELRKDVLQALKAALKKEKKARARSILKDIIENARLAKKKRIAICQDTGIVSAYLEIGADCAVKGDIEKAVDRGVEDAYKKGYLRKSIVDDPLLRKNTATNTPCVINEKIVPGDRIRITVSPKGFGSENKSAVKMLKPTAAEKDIIEFVAEVVRAAGAEACPPLVLGVGLGGTFDMAAALSKKALLRPIGSKNEKKHIKKLEKDILAAVNAMGLGPMGLGGKATALGVNIEEYPTHIAGLPVAVSVSCHATRSAEKTL
jgi:fumarate hydratase subunit alpha